MKKHKLYVSCVLLIIFSLIGNILYYNAQQLDEPIVLEHYIEDRVYENQDVNMRFYYISNLNDNNKLSNVSFPKHDLTFYAQNGDAYDTTHYKANIAFLQAPYSLLNFDGNDEIILEDAVITYSNGLTQNVDIGKIILTKGGNNDLKSTMSSASNSGQVSQYYSLEDSITVNKVTSRLYDETNDFVYMHFVDNDSSNITFPVENTNIHDKKEDKIFLAIDELSLPHEASNSLEVFSYVKPEDEKRFNVYEMIYTLEFTYKDGKEGREDLLNLRYKPCFTNKLVSELVK